MATTGDNTMNDENSATPINHNDDSNSSGRDDDNNRLLLLSRYMKMNSNRRSRNDDNNTYSATNNSDNNINNNFLSDRSSSFLTAYDGIHDDNNDVQDTANTSHSENSFTTSNKQDRDHGNNDDVLSTTPLLLSSLPIRNVDSNHQCNKKKSCNLFLNDILATTDSNDENNFDCYVPIDDHSGRDHHNGITRSNVVHVSNHNIHNKFVVSWVEHYIHLLSKCTNVILMITILMIWPMGHYCFLHFQELTDSTFHPIPNSPSDIAMKAYQNAYAITPNHNNNNRSSMIDWNNPMNPPLIIMLEDIYHNNNNNNNNDDVNYTWTKQTNIATTEHDHHNDHDHHNGAPIYNTYLSPMTNDPTSESYQSAYQFTHGLLPYLMNETYNCWTWPSTIHAYDDVDDDSNHDDHHNDTTKKKICHNKEQWLHITSYYSLIDDGLSYIANSTMKSYQSGEVALMIVQYTFPNDDDNISDRDRKYRMKQLMYAIDNYKNFFFSSNQSTSNNHSNIQYFHVKYTGIKYFSSDLLLSTLHDIKRMDIIVIPLALLLIGIVIPKCSPYVIWIIPVITIVTTICTWSVIMYGIISSKLTTLQISTFTPTLMMSLSLGMGIDYTLFLLARYSEEYRNNHRHVMEDGINTNTNHIAIRNMLMGSGSVLILSGLTLTCTFIGLIVLPLSMLRSIGIGASVAILSSLAVNLVIVPTLLLTKLGNLIISNTIVDNNNSNKQYEESNYQSSFEVETTSDHIPKQPNELTTPLLLHEQSNMDSIVPARSKESHSSLTGSDGRKTVVRFHESVMNHQNNHAENSNGIMFMSSTTFVNQFENHAQEDQETVAEHDQNGNDRNGPLQTSFSRQQQPRVLSQQQQQQQQQQHRHHQQQRSIWLRFAKHLLHPYKGIIILLVTCQILAPIAQQFISMKTSLSFDLLLPKKSPSLIAYHELEQKFTSTTNNNNGDGNGRMNPYRILFDATNTNITITSEIGFQIIHHVIEALRFMDHRISTSLYSDDSILHHDCRFVAMMPFCWPFHNDKVKRNDHHEYNWTNDNVNFISNEIDELANIILHNDAEKWDFYASNFNNSSQSSKPHVPTSTRKQHTEYNGIAILRNINIPYSMFASARYCSHLEPYCPIELLHVLNEIDHMSTSYNNKATVVTATLMDTNPFSDNGMEWLLHARKVLNQLQNKPIMHGVNVYIDGSAGIAYDAVHSVYLAFPRMIISTSIIIFILMGLFCQSIFVPLRSIISIGITLSFSFGLTVCVFQENKLLYDPWNIHTTSTDAIGSTNLQEISWLVPIMGFSIIVGLALDYDIFLISRILEYRIQNYEHRTSIAYGLHSTGSIITAAGIIMAVSFGSLMFSSNPVLYQWSFLLTTAVLLDTFVVRTCVVPVLTNLAGPKYCWWPRRLSEYEHPSNTVEQQHPSVICLPEYKEKQRFSPDDVACLLRTLEQSSEYEPLRV